MIELAKPVRAVDAGDGHGSASEVGEGGWSRGPFVHVRYPWRAFIDTRSPYPARYYAGLVGQAMRYGLPASRRLPRLWTLAARRGIPETALARCLRLFPGRRRADVESVIAGVGAAWPQLKARSRRLPASPGQLTTLVLARRAARTVFVFGATPWPLLVLKDPPAGDGRAEHEASALDEAGSLGAGPRYLGRLGHVFVQEGLPGRAMSVEELAVGRAAELEWPDSLRQLSGCLTALAAATRKAEPPQDWRPAVELALGDPDLAADARNALAAAAKDVGRLESSVLCHRDASPQNCIFRDHRLEGLVDWETALSRGLPGLDAWVAAISYLDHCLGLVAWDERTVVQGFRQAWTHSQFYRDARLAIRAAAVAGGAPEAAVDALQVVFCGIRHGHRLSRPNDWPTAPSTTARVLEAVAL